VARIFISYRRDDSGGYAGRLFDWLSQHFGRDNVFIDVDDIRPGSNFVAVIQNAVGSCDVLLAVIGRQWLTSTNPQGQRRLDDPEDFVRLEITTALTRNILVIPVLVGGASMPRTNELPDVLQPFAYCQAFEVRERFHPDVDLLIEELEKVLGAASYSSASSPAPLPPLKATVTARIFLCHAGEDKAQVREVYHRLRAISGFEPWLDEADLLPGQEWAREIPRALQTSDFILIFLSRSSIAKRSFVQREMKLALDVLQELPEGTIHTIPVRLDACDVPEGFRGYHRVDLFEPHGFDDIVRAIRIEIAKRQGTEPKPSTFTNSIGMEFVRIPAGTFIMGSPDTDAEAFDVEKPAHRVTISQPFYLGKYPVTQAQWEAVMGNNPSEFKGNRNCPVENVSWDDVQVFLRKLNEQEGGGGYCLSTEAQWEHACRAGTEAPRYHPDVNAIAWYRGNNNAHPQPVGQKLPNAWGLYDMLGNVWEWCHDGRRTYTADAVVDPMGPTDADADRVIRGGCWLLSERRVRAAYRGGNPPGDRLIYLGFRCASSGPSK